MSPRHCSINYVPKRNRFSVSYGLVVFTKYPTTRVVLVERKIPYCLYNRLWKNVYKQSFNTMSVSGTGTETKNFTKRIRMRSNMSVSSIIRYIRKFINSYNVEDLKLNESCEIQDFIKYKTGKVFEDKYDFPHGQMTRKTKSYLNRNIDFLRRSRNIKRRISNNNDDNNNNNNQEDYKEKLLKKFAGFITAFTEFEEETGYTFKFDSDMVKNEVTEMVLQFTGLDNYIYEQHFFIVVVDKIEKLKRGGKEEKKEEEKTTKVFHKIISLEIDRQVYEPKCVDVEEAKKLFLCQQKDSGKVDMKHMLLCCFSNDYDRLIMKENFNKFCMETTTTTTTNNDSEDEIMFLDMVKHIEPKVYIKSVRRIRWRDR